MNDRQGMIVRWTLMLVLVGCGCMRPFPDMRVANRTVLTDIDASQAAGTDGIRLLEDTATTGRFPSGVAVARVTRTRIADALELGEVPADATRDLRAQAAPSDPVVVAANVPAVQLLASMQSSGSTEVYVHSLRGYENAHWAELFDSTPDIREVVPVHANSVRGDRTTVNELLASATRLNTELLLVFGYDNTSDYDACTVCGVLLDVASGRPLALIQQTRTLTDARIAAMAMPEWARPEKDKDLLFFLDQYAFRAFEDSVRECVWTLIDRDSGPTGAEPNPFQDPKPPYQMGGREWR